MNVDREVAQIYARQAQRAARVAIIVAVGGGIGSLTAAAMVATQVPRTSPLASNGYVFFGALSVGIAVTAVLYALASALQTHAEATAARHLGAALADEDADE